MARNRYNMVKVVKRPHEHAYFTHNSTVNVHSLKDENTERLSSHSYQRNRSDSFFTDSPHRALILSQEQNPSRSYSNGHRSSSIQHEQTRSQTHSDEIVKLIRT